MTLVQVIAKWTSIMINFRVIFRSDTVFGLQRLNADSNSLVLVEDDILAMHLYQELGINVIAVSPLKGMLMPQQVL